MLAHIADAIILAEADARIMDANPAACAMLGYSRKELLGMHPWDFVTSASRAEITKLMQELEPEAPVTVQRTFRKKTGERRTIELRVTRFGCLERDLFVASCRDLTEHVRLQEQLRDFEERRRVEEELRRLNSELSEQAAHLREVNRTLLDSEQRLRLAIETGRIGLWVWNSTDVKNSGDWSQQLKEIFGLPLDAEVTHDVFLKCVHREDRERVDQAVMQALAGANGGNYRAEYRTIHPRDGSEHWVTARGQAFFDSEGRAIRFIGTVMDITERKLAEEASVRLTHELEERVRERTASLLRTQRLSQTGSSSWDVSTGEIVWSEETYRIFGIDPGVKITPEMAASRIHPDDLPKLRQMFASEGEDFQFDHRILMPDGATKHLQAAATAVRDNSGELKESIGAVYFNDWGKGQPIAFSHGWPLSADAFEDQMFFLASRGYRCIAHDRRGHGRSSQPWNGNDLDTYADDLATLVETLDLKDAIHVGHSTGGGEVARYIGRHGTKRVAKAVLIGAIPPLILKTAANPGGLPIEVFDQLRAGVVTDRSQFFKDLSLPFYGYNRPGAKISEGVRESFWLHGMMAGFPASWPSSSLEAGAIGRGRTLRRRVEHGGNALRRLRAGQGVAHCHDFQ